MPRGSRKVKQYSELVDELTNFINNTFPKEHMYSKIEPSPIPAIAPETWLLGTSEKGAVLAAEKGLPYVFGQFMSSKDGPVTIRTYEESFRPSDTISKPKSIVAVAVICAETTEGAESLAWSNYLWSIKQGQTINGVLIPPSKEAQNYTYNEEELQSIEKMKQKMIIGNPNEVKERLLEIQAQYGVDELMIITITHCYEARLKSYELIAKKMFL